MALKSLNFTLLVVNLDSETLSELAEELNKRRLMAPEFFAQTPMVVNIVKTSLNIDFLQLQRTVEEHGFILTGITGKVSKEQKQQANEHSIAVLHGSTRQVIKAVPATQVSEQLEEIVVPAEETDDVVDIPPSFVVSDVKTKVHVGRVRSGQQIYAKECDLVINGDVGAGAEVIADGCIHVYGALRGKALAGAMGNTNAAIFCQTLQPELVSIAGVYKLSEALPENMWSTACSVSLDEQNMVFSSLNKI
ncbi:septum site-determining protein MinC [Psychromonas sp. RZ22]|uniref:septum site-determining protein MinC n=1 Tax=Psychromonas algarum TaxID=2555643 RepID=UPI001067BCD5|nr:septum site-determining protein MinC [Psychromonas sp. RZ22]TEW54375.1 septum site-determining protein MinC [Psychromonas sp. RZ22]